MRFAVNYIDKTIGRYFHTDECYIHVPWDGIFWWSVQVTVLPFSELADWWWVLVRWLMGGEVADWWWVLVR